MTFFLESFACFFLSFPVLIMHGLIVNLSEINESNRDRENPRY